MSNNWKNKIKLLFADVVIVDLVALHIFTSQNRLKGRKTSFTIEMTTTIKLK